MAKKKPKPFEDLVLKRPVEGEAEPKKSMSERTQDLRIIEAKLFADLEDFGDHLAVQQGYRNLHGIEAVQYFLMQKHNWLPAQVKSMSWEDLQFAMSQDRFSKKKPV